ncbi:hypothetical protein XELAEV_18010721mg [Xenopus laevis]|uniref:Uncharacterized protein n=1 Tax=Xenopus laevis TaxID=8355 RepID=A0A974DX86_XENLA|nr:hypothetical protein XELAEV_18010721mg [Xenopus laevis]
MAKIGCNSSSITDAKYHHSYFFCFAFEHVCAKLVFIFTYIDISFSFQFVRSVAKIKKSNNSLHSLN